MIKNKLILVLGGLTILAILAILALVIILRQIAPDGNLNKIATKDLATVSLPTLLPASPPASPSVTPETADFTASFEITTNGTKRIFTDVMYHRQSSDLYIEKSDPSLIQVKKTGATWNDFFQTLPFSLTKTCLVTGTKQTFCSGETKKLRFFLDGVETPGALENKIGAGAHLRVTYGN